MALLVTTTVTKEGLQPIPPAELRALLVALVMETNPGFTANLPASLVEDIVSTDIAALSIMDQARVDLVNSLTPRLANPYLLNQLGAIYGVAQGVGSNTSVYVVFSGTVGFVLSVGFTVSDGTYQYVVRGVGGVIGSDGDSLPLYCVATQSGSWSVPANTVTNFVTSVPSGITLTVTNPQAGIPGAAAQSDADYRKQVMQAGTAVAVGTTAYLKLLLGNVPGTQARLISVRAVTGGWEVICGGGDPYQVGDAIFRALPDLQNVVGSTMSVANVTKATNAQVSTLLNHGYVAGDNVTFADVVGMTQLNGNTYPVVTVIDEKNFIINVNSTVFSTYISGGVLTPNPRNVQTSINDYPDVYSITFVNPPQQDVRMAITWNTTSVNFVSNAAVAQLASAGLVTYVNNVPVGVPLNLYEMQTVFMESIASILAPQLLTRLVFNVFINGELTAPVSGSGIIGGDPESFFLTNSALIAVAQG